MKKMTALLLAVLMVLSMAACASKPAEESDLAYIQDKGTLVVGITDFAPMDYQNESGEWIGFDADLAKAFADSLGVKVEFVEIVWDNKVLELDSKTIDCVWNGMTLTSEVTSAMACSNAYCNNAQVVIVPADKAADYQTVESVKDLTFAAEAGTQRLRNVINKNVTWDEIEKTCTIAFNAGYTSVKLYFMMGLPTETMEDIEGIAETAQKVVDLYYSLPKRGKGKGVQVTISCACFVPKPHTPFEFVPMDTEEMLRAKQKHLLESVHSRKIKVNYHDSTTSFLEGVFAKGDRRLAPVIVEAYKRGCYFDGWEECFKYDTWLQTFADLGIDPAFYCQRPIGLDEVTPWSHMDYGVTHEYLVREYQKALAAQTTQPCNRACHGCGANHLLGGPCFDYSKNLV